MSRKLTREEILNSKAVHLYRDYTIYVELQEDEVYCLNKGSVEWQKRDNFYDYFESSLMMSYFTPITREEAAIMFEEWTKIATEEAEKRSLENKERLNQAICFAIERHSGQFRKGTTTPYIVHPLETMTILANMNADIDLLIAGVLHDTVEDTDTSLDEIKNTFGEEVANLVAGHSEDKSNTWEERKEKQYHDACKANLRQKKLILADKLANLRSIHKDYKIIGEQLWDRFNEGAIKQCWYYGKMIDALYDLQYYSETEYYYWEMLGVYKDVFVVFALYEKENIIYQENIAGEKYMFMNNNPDWLICDTPTPENAIRIERKYAERLEDNWREQFYTRIDRDILDGSYSLYSSETGGLTISIKEGKLALSGSNYGERCEVVNGKDEYEFYYTLNPGDTHALMVFLRNKYGTKKKLATILKNELGYDDGSARFEELCRNIGVTYKFFSF